MKKHIKKVNTIIPLLVARVDSVILNNPKRIRKAIKTMSFDFIASIIPTIKMVMVSFGESNAVCTESSDSCYERNRRVDIRLMK